MTSKQTAKRGESLPLKILTSATDKDILVVCVSVCVCWSPLLAAQGLNLRRAQLNGIGRMHVKGASGCCQTVMNDPRAQQPSQVFFTWVKTRPQHWELCALLLTNSVWVLQRPTIIYNKGCETGPPAYSPYPRRLEGLTICWCNYKGSTFCSVTLRPWVLVRSELNSRPSAW